MFYETLLSQMHEVSNQIKEELENPVSTQQAAVVDCNDIDAVATLIIINATNLITLINIIIGVEEDNDPINHGYIAQLQRLICIFQLLITRLESLPCTERCSNLLEELLCILLQIFNLTVAINTKLIAIASFRSASIFFECALCELVDEITDLENLLKDLACIVVSLLSCDIDDCTPCFVATNSNKRPNSIQDKNICPKHNESNCSCKK